MGILTEAGREPTPCSRIECSVSAQSTMAWIPQNRDSGWLLFWSACVFCRVTPRLPWLQCQSPALAHRTSLANNLVNGWRLSSAQAS